MKRLVLLVCLSLMLSSGCSDRREEAEGISISLIPSENVLISLGPEPSCLDRTNYLRALKAGGQGVVLNRSVSGIVAGFNGFTLTWTKQEILYVQAIRVTVMGAGITGGEYKFSVSNIEVENLLARSEGIVHPTVDPNDPSKFVPTVINSNDQNRETLDPLYARCGLKIGQIPLVDKEETLPFTANIEVELIGRSENSEGQWRFVRARTRARAQYFGS